MEATDLLYSAPLQEMESAPRFYLLSLYPACPRASDASGSGVVERWEDQNGVLTGVETRGKVRAGFGERRRERRGKEIQKKEEMTQGDGMFI